MINIIKQEIPIDKSNLLKIYDTKVEITYNNMVNFKY